MHEPLEYRLWGYMFVWVWIRPGICIEVGGQPWVLALTFMLGELGYKLLEIFFFLPPIHPFLSQKHEGIAASCMVVSGLYVVSQDLDLGR